MNEFVALSFGMCAALVPHVQPLLGGLVGIGNVRGGIGHLTAVCDVFFIGGPSDGEALSLQGHAVVVDSWDNGMIVTVDGVRFLVPRSVSL